MYRYADCGIFREGRIVRIDVKWLPQNLEGSSFQYLYVMNGVGEGYIDPVTSYLAVNDTERVVASFIDSMFSLGLSEGILVFPGATGETVSDGNVELLETQGIKIHTLYADNGYPLDIYRIGMMVGKKLGKNQDGKILISLKPQAFLASKGHWFVAVAGEVEKPGIYGMAKGDCYGDLLESAGWGGGESSEELVLLAGNPVSGRIVRPEWPAEEEEGLLLVLKNDHMLVDLKSPRLTEAVCRVKSLCNRCLICSDYCPAASSALKLEPHLLMKDIQSGYVAEAEHVEASIACTDCGVCSIVCPHNLPVNKIVSDIRKEYEKEYHFTLEGVAGSGGSTSAFSSTDRLHETTRLARKVYANRLGLFRYMERLGVSWY